jgi:HD-GYP domain-containing protein (c-di-GMP phosphodiesterase class II)
MDPSLMSGPDVTMQSLTLLHSDQFPIDRYRKALEQDSIAPRAVSSWSELSAASSMPSVVLVDHRFEHADHGATFPPVSVLLGVGLENPPDWVSSEQMYMSLPAEPATGMLVSAVLRAQEYLRERLRNAELKEQLAQRNQELEEISKISIALSTVRDHEVLLAMILTKSREMSRSDAGSLYLLDEEDGQKALRWKLVQNDSIPTEGFEEKVLPFTKKSLAGYVAMTGETLVIDDAYELPAGAEYSINTSFDRDNGYLTRSMLVFPMTNHVGDIIGVLQLINRKRSGAPSTLTAATVPDQVIPFDEHTIQLMRSLAGQAAVAFENNLLYESIERLFEGFVTASVTAIEQRDPTTSGHSFRVADLTVELAKTVDHLADPPFNDIRFTQGQIRELRYASLLHDFGKVGVREKVLVKEKKFYPLQIDIVRSRFDYMVRSLEAEYERKKLDFLMKHGFEGFEAFGAETDRELEQRIAALEADFAFIVKSNEPTVLPEGEFQHLQGLGTTSFVDLRGNSQPLLHPEEVRVLSIRKGNLDDAERGEIESHVTHTFRFLSKIPWTKDLRGVPGIAYAHHEKLNGRGYPLRLVAGAIPVQSRMMTVSDIYDALTANDRPYKKAVSTERALDILNMEVKDGLLDHELVRVFMDAKIYEHAGVVRHG